jgi:hypothetical protein
LLYKNDHGNRRMATVHGVVQQNADGSPVARWSSYRTMSSREPRTCWRGGHRRRCGQCFSARDRNLRPFQADGFRTRPCYL